MSDTPRTDELLTAMLDIYGYVHQGNCPQQWVNYARELERELNEWKRWCKEKEQALDDLAKVFSQQQDRIKRLEEALEGTVKLIVHLADSGDAGFWDVEKQSEIIAARAALKNKDKP